MSPKRRIHTRYWAISVGISLIICSLGLIELLIRRQASPNFYLLNKSIASTAFVTIALSYTLSAFCSFNPKYKHLLASSDDDNLVIRAAKLLQETVGVSRGADICLTKRIPMQAGLGGGSSDAGCDTRRFEPLLESQSFF